MPPCHDCSEHDLAEVDQASLCLDRPRDPTETSQIADEILDAFHYACDARDVDVAGRLLQALAALLRDVPDVAPLRRGPAASVWAESVARLHTIRGSR